MPRSVLWIIDGYNLIRRDPRLRDVEQGVGSAAARQALEGQLGLFRARVGRGHSVALVYDGAPVREGAAKRTKGVRVVFPSDGYDADWVIVQEARRVQGRFQVNVVTSDYADIGSRMRGLDVTWMTVEQFSPELWRPGRRRGRQGARSQEAVEDEGNLDKPQPPEGSEVDYWLWKFGEPPERKHEGE